MTASCEGERQRIGILIGTPAEPDRRTMSRRSRTDALYLLSEMSAGGLAGIRMAPRIFYVPEKERFLFVYTGGKENV